MAELAIEDRLKLSLVPHFYGLFRSAKQLMDKMDSPLTTLHELRNSEEAKRFRSRLLHSRQWLEGAMNALPETAIPPEERRLLKFYFDELDEAVRRAG